MVRIAIDGTPLSVPTGGVRRYTQELSRALARDFPADSVWHLTDQEIPPTTGVRQGERPSSLMHRRWWLAGLPAQIRKIGAEIFHGTDFAIPYVQSCPTVMTVHDLSPWKPEFRSAASARVRRRTQWLLRLNLADMVITPSTAVRQEVMARFGLASERVHAVPLAASDHFFPSKATPSSNYFLYVGALEKRKNIELILNAWRELRKTVACDLILAGAPRPDFPLPHPEPGLQVLGTTPEAALPELYSNALALLYPSRYEGFGLPVLEAMQCGTAVIASRDPAIAETAGDAGVLLDVGHYSAWVDAMRAAATSGEWRGLQSEKSLARARHFSWSRTAKLTRQVYVDAMERYGR